MQCNVASALFAEERDEYDDEFERMRAENLKTRVVQAQDELRDATKRVDECRIKLGKARNQVMFWRMKVDRQCIERLKNFQNPPVLVGHVMEMIFTLIGKRTVQRVEKADYPSKDDVSARFSASSSSTKLNQKKSESNLSMTNLHVHTLCIHVHTSWYSEATAPGPCVQVL